MDKHAGLSHEARDLPVGQIVTGIQEDCRMGRTWSRSEPCSSPSRPRPTAAPAGEALVDRFMAVIPDAQRLNQVDRTPNPEELAHLNRLNPGREATSDSYWPSTRPANPTGRRTPPPRASFAGLPAGSTRHKLGRLIQFYEGDDFRNFEALMRRSNGGATPSDADRAELERIMAAYPLMEYHEGFQAAYFTLFEDPTFITALDRLLGSEASGALRAWDFAVTD